MLDNDNLLTRTTYEPDDSGVDEEMEGALYADDLMHYIAASVTVGLAGRVASECQDKDTPPKCRPILMSLWARIILRERQ